MAQKISSFLYQEGVWDALNYPRQ